MALAVLAVWCLRTLLERCKTELAVVAINDMADLKTNAHLFRYDSTYGIYPGKIEMHRRRDERRRPKHRRSQPERSRPLALETAGRRYRHRSHWGIYRRRASARPSRRRREEGHHHRPRDQRRHHPGAGRQRSAITIRASIILCRTPRARPIAWRRWRKCCTTTSASSAA